MTKSSVSAEFRPDIVWVPLTKYKQIMSAPNFNYENRCVLVRDSDFEDGNLPPMGDFLGFDRNYQSREVLPPGQYKFRFHDLVITSGYYSDACLDFIRNDNDIHDMLYLPWYDMENSITEVKDSLRRQFKISRAKLNAMFGKWDKVETKWKFIDRGLERAADYLAELEREKCNEAIDIYKQMYRYEELAVSVRFSNGETWYTRVA